MLDRWALCNHFPRSLNVRHFLSDARVSKMASLTATSRAGAVAKQAQRSTPVRAFSVRAMAKPTGAAAAAAGASSGAQAARATVVPKASADSEGGVVCRVQALHCTALLQQQQQCCCCISSSCVSAPHSKLIGPLQLANGCITARPLCRARRGRSWARVCSVQAEQRQQECRAQRSSFLLCISVRLLQ